MSVYRIKSPHSDKVYIGGTFQTLNQRFSEHKSQYKRWLRGDPKALYYSSYEVLKLGDAYIEQVDLRHRRLLFLGSDPFKSYMSYGKSRKS